MWIMLQVAEVTFEPLRFPVWWMTALTILAVIGLPMRFGVFLPPQAQKGPVGAVVYLAGLTCNEETFAIKAGAQRRAAELGLAEALEQPKDLHTLATELGCDSGALLRAAACSHARPSSVQAVLACAAAASAARTWSGASWASRAWSAARRRRISRGTASRACRTILPGTPAPLSARHGIQPSRYHPTATCRRRRSASVLRTQPPSTVAKIACAHMTLARCLPGERT